MNDELIEKILQTLEGQKFADFYSDNGPFGRYISGETRIDTGKSHDEIRESLKPRIAALFHLNS